MKTMICVISILLFFVPLTSMAEEERYLTNKKVYHETPDGDDVMIIHTSLGYSTDLAFPDRPTMVSTGDSSLLQVEIPKNSKNVLIKPLYEKGETNLFVFTPTQRFNYHIVIDPPGKADYVVDVGEDFRQLKSDSETSDGVKVERLLKMVRNYNALKTMGVINTHHLFQKDIFTSFEKDGIKVEIIEAFTYQKPHYLILHVIIQNLRESSITLSERKTGVYIKDFRIRPDYVFFDGTTVHPQRQIHGWLVLRNTYISGDNPFTIGLGIGENEYVFN